MNAKPTTKTAAVAVNRLAALVKGLTSLITRAAKLGQEITYTVSAPRFIAQENDTAVEVVDVTVTGRAPLLAGWTFAAQIEHMTDELGQPVNLIREMSPVPASFQTAPAACSHCNLSRRRRMTYVVINETGEIKQVGSTCVDDFTGGSVSPAALAAMFAIDANLETLLSDESWDHGLTGGGGGATGYGLLRVLTLAAASIRQEGYVSRRQAEERLIASTAVKVSMALDGKSTKYAIAYTEADQAVAAATAAWAKEIPVGADSDTDNFTANLGAIARIGYVGQKMLGFAAYMPAAYKRELARVAMMERAARQAEVSTYQGTCGGAGVKPTRLRDLHLLVVKIITFEGMMGTTWLHIMSDAEGNAYKWFSTAGPLEEGIVYVIDGTVKKHEPYTPRGSALVVKTTVLTRCAAETEDAYAARLAAEAAEKAAKAAAQKAARAAKKAAPKASAAA
jgi:ribosomal protein L36